MENNKNINWAWILTAVFWIFWLWIMADLIQSEREVKEKQKIIDSLSNEILLLEDAVEMREREVDLMMSDFDKGEEIDKTERILKEDKWARRKNITSGTGNCTDGLDGMLSMLTEILHKDLETYGSGFPLFGKTGTGTTTSSSKF